MKKVIVSTLGAFLCVFFIGTAQTGVAQSEKDITGPILLGDVNDVKKLIQEGVDVNQKIEFGAQGKVTPLWFAVMAGKAEISKLLIDEGADINFKQSNNMTLLHVCALYAKAFEAGDHNHKEVAELLIDNGLDVNAKCAGGKVKGITPLHAAAGKGSLEVANVLIKKGAGVNERVTSNGFSPLHVAVVNGKAEIAKILMSNGADINARTKQEQTPLDKAVSEEHNEIADLIRENGGVSGKKKENYNRNIINSLYLTI